MITQKANNGDKKALGFAPIAVLFARWISIGLGLVIDILWAVQSVFDQYSSLPTTATTTETQEIAPHAPQHPPTPAWEHNGVMMNERTSNDRHFDPVPEHATWEQVGESIRAGVESVDWKEVGRTLEACSQSIDWNQVGRVIAAAFQAESSKAGTRSSSMVTESS